MKNRRSFLKTSALAASFPALVTTARGQDASLPTGERLRVGSIGTGSRWNAVGRHAMKYGDIVAVCDVDQEHLAGARQTVEEQQGKAPDAYDDYRRILDRDDIDVVTIVTPDHWHTKIAVEAMRAGKDVYCEKPLTLTIDEGKQIIAALEETGRVFQVGTQQRSEFGGRFLQAIALAHSGRLGEIKKVTCGINRAPTSAPIPLVPAPQTLDWERWLGPAPLADYRFDADSDARFPPTRCHYEFRWWYEYSGGKMTDWGAHNVDIAQWAIGMDKTGPNSVRTVNVEHPVPLDPKGNPTDPSRYNVAHKFEVQAMFRGDIEMIIRSEGDNGILIEGTEGRIFVNRNRLTGAPVERLKEEPLPEEAIAKLYRGRQPGDHMRNFFESVADRTQPISDVYTHHRAISTCHLANISMRLGRDIEWDPDRQQIIGDDVAAAMLSRAPRKGYELEA